MRYAFSLLELVFVLVLIGILSIALLPSNDRDSIGEAAHNVARHIRLAQHYALMEDRALEESQNPPQGWQETMWRLTFINGAAGLCYRVFADRDGGGNADADERAIDPFNGMTVWSNTCQDIATSNPDVLLWKKYGITNVNVNCPNFNPPRQHIAFNHFGRPGQVKPFGGNPSTFNPIPFDCNITLTANDGRQATITIERETGYTRATRIDGQLIP